MDERLSWFDPIAAQLAIDPYLPVQLSPEDEQAFRAQFTSSPWYQDFVRQFREHPRIDGDYDYRRAWLHGMLPQAPGEHGLSVVPETGMWLKNPRTHPTAWMELAAQRGMLDPQRGMLR